MLTLPGGVICWYPLQTVWIQTGHRSGSKLFATLMLFLSQNFKIKILWKKYADDRKGKQRLKIPSMQIVKSMCGAILLLTLTWINNVGEKQCWSWSLGLLRIKLIWIKIVGVLNARSGLNFLKTFTGIFLSLLNYVYGKLKCSKILINSWLHKRWMDKQSRPRSDCF